MLKAISILASLACALVALPVAYAQEGSASSKMSPQDALQPPARYFQKAVQHWSKGEPDEATFWFYVGQLRYRAYLTANPNLDPTGDPALFSALMESVGRPINEYAFGDTDNLIAILDRALVWDNENPDPRVPESVRSKTRAGLIQLRDKIGRDAAIIRQKREANGLPNR